MSERGRNDTCHENEGDDNVNYMDDTDAVSNITYIDDAITNKPMMVTKTLCK